MRISATALRRIRRVGLWSAVVAVVVAMAASGFALWSVRHPFPTTDGELRLAVLTAPVTVLRDGNGIPQIYAENEDDLFRAQGYVHAQDRFWEMDLRRHITAGRLAEMFGPDQVETDVFVRTLGWREAARAEWDRLSPDARRRLLSYAAGVNAWIEANGGRDAHRGKALQYSVLAVLSPGYRVEPWDPVDSVAWLKAMAWDLVGNLWQEINRAAVVLEGRSRTQAEELYPAYPSEAHQPIVPMEPAAGPEAEPRRSTPVGGLSPDDLEQARDGLETVRRAAASLPEPVRPGGPGTGSNSWVVAGARTASGAPILVNDPHLAPSLPGVWYQLGLHCDCGYRVAGFSFAGMPGVVIGHNERIAWGLTNLPTDVTDLYLERLDGDRYAVGDQWRPLAVREERISVAGESARTVRIRHTRHGPLLSDAFGQLRDIGAKPPLGPDGAPAETAQPAPGGGYAVALAWTALEPGRSVEALFAVNQARNWADFRAATALFDSPAQNFVYADVDGNIGYQAAGSVPVRGAGDGRWMSPGWDPAYDWTGRLPFAELPHLFNPEGGVIVTANQAVTAPDSRRWLTADWSYGYRSDRIGDLLAESAGRRLDLADMERMLTDDRNGLAPELVPALLAVPAERLGGGPSAGRDLLRDWDFRQPADCADGGAGCRSSAAAAFFNATWRHLLAGVFDELPEHEPPLGDDRWFVVVARLLDQPDASWWDRQETGQVERRDDMLAAAMRAAHEELTAAQGDEPDGWRWGRAHTLTPRDQSFGVSGVGAVEWLFNHDPVPVSGGTDAVNATAWNAADGYEVTELPSMRMAVDLADLNAARWVQVTGNSGHAYHPHHTDQLDVWRTGRMLRWYWLRADIEAAAEDTLTLRP
ncbi:penicillin acylase family protein [Plantactinospora sp. BC1]|uniref:penicillin acylase family protein n=1 Tax=Plantactinospora sp. BC1 TaxID=2108470 RepID=UPI000D15E09A|nr:penicillin acylase family protein [Plantactinospora sp. BC1]AVT28849.1 penicillin acylase family protein [Plantactinospora sp. BC1]